MSGRGPALVRRKVNPVRAAPSTNWWHSRSVKINFILLQQREYLFTKKKLVNIILPLANLRVVIKQLLGIQHAHSYTEVSANITVCT